MRYLFIFLTILTFFIGCTSKPIESVPTEINETTVKEINVADSTDKKTNTEVPEITLPKEEVIKEEPQKVEEIVPEKVNDEFSRSTRQLNGEVISQETFTEDKNSLLNIISELSIIMANKDYNEWVKYLSQESILYWRNTSNLATVSKRLPVKGLRLRTLEDYFKFVFIPSRLNKTVDEIRYVSKSLVKVVKMKAEEDTNHDVIYYTFEKINNKWYLHLDKL